MSLQWTAVATFLYTEIFLCLLFILPIISAQRWQKIFKSRLFNSFRSYANLYFNIFIVILLILFFDSIRDVRKYSEPMGQDVDLKNNPNAEAVVHMKLFRAQRNFYIAGFALFLFLFRLYFKYTILPLRHSVWDMSKYQSIHNKIDMRVQTEAARAINDMKMFRSQRNYFIAGFSLFLWVVLRKLVTMISKEAHLMAESEAAQAQAKSASDAARRMMDDTDKAATDDGETEELREKLSQAKMKIMEIENEIIKGKTDMETMKKQADATNREYDRLAEEHVKVQKKLEQLEGEEGSKKDD